jgi:DNA-binding NarL/FixJ family response regulator
MSEVPAPAPVRVVVADDSGLIREGLTAMLAGREDVELAGTGSDGEELDELIATARPDVVVTDLRMPPSGGREGIRVATRLRRSDPQIGVVVLSQYVEPGYALALLEHGSEGRAYLLKERVSDVDQLLHAIVEVAAGGSVIDPKVVETLVTARSRHRDSPLEHLTPREREVLAEMAQGRNNASVAAALGLSERAVEKHINSLFSKLALSEETDGHRRVKAVLVYLSAHDT